MGTTYQAVCDCGYQSEKMYCGAGMSDSTGTYEVACEVPTICRACKVVGTSQVFGTLPRCAVCGSTEVDVAAIPRNVSKSWPITAEDLSSIDWPIVDHKGPFWCPKCGNRSLQVMKMGFWD